MDCVNETNVSLFDNSSVITREVELPLPAVIFSVVYLGIDTVFGLISNTLLILIIYNSPSLRTPPNSHLVNISVNNVLLCVTMVFSMVTVSKKENKNDNFLPFTGIELFGVTACSLQYLLTFASIGFYRNRTMQRPNLSLKVRKTMVSRSILINWLITHVLSLVFTLAFMENDRDIKRTLNPLRRTFIISLESALTVEQMSAMGFLVIAYLVGIAIIFRSYYNICRTLNMPSILSGRNRVAPTNRTLSLSSDTAAELQLHIRQHYTPEELSGMKQTYTISTGQYENGTVVHYQKNEHSLAFEDIFALENPILAASIRNKAANKRPLQATLSNSSNASTKSKCPDFSDISPGGDLERLQTMKNNSALRKQSLKRDRINLSSATKNSMTMLAAYVTCSFPLLICSFPEVLWNLELSRIYILLFCRLVFYINVCIYPLWYLLFSKRVRKCMFRLFETVLVRLKVRR